jgi:hypothetical protein
MARDHVVSGWTGAVYVNETDIRSEILTHAYLSETTTEGIRQVHFRFRTDAGAADASPSWGDVEDVDYYPGTSAFRLRFSLSNVGEQTTGTLNHALYVSKNGGAYAPVTTSSTDGVQSTNASSDADDTLIKVPRLTKPLV